MLSGKDIRVGVRRRSTDIARGWVKVGMIRREIQVAVRGVVIEVIAGGGLRGLVLIVVVVVVLGGYEGWWKGLGTVWKYELSVASLGCGGSGTLG